MDSENSVAGHLAAPPCWAGRCAYDSDGDGDCHLCVNRGGCSAIGGPFEIRPITPSIEHLQQMGILQVPYDDGFNVVT